MYNPNNYGYNPYGRYQQPIQQEPFTSVQNRSGLQGKQVESVEIVRSLDVPFDGSISYFPTIDKSAIVTKQLQNDGTVKTMIYKPFVEKEKEEEKIDFKALINDIKEIKKEIKSLKKVEENE